MSSSIYKPVSQKPPANKNVQTSSSVDVSYVDTKCGFWMWKPVCIQLLAKIGTFTAFTSFAYLMTQTLTHYVNSQVTTLERQFGFSSRQTGIIVAANDIGYLVSVLFVAHVANRVHIPRSLGISVIIYGISGIFCSLPHFLFGATINDPTTEIFNSTESNFSKQSAVVGSLCDIFNNTRDPCGIAAVQNSLGQSTQATTEKITQISLVIIVIGMALQGFGKAPRISFTCIYVDDNTDKVNTGFYAGAIVSAAVLGPAVAFLLGGVFSRMHVTLEGGFGHAFILPLFKNNFTKTTFPPKQQAVTPKNSDLSMESKATQLTPRHPKWVGAWWLGYVVFGVASLVVAIPLFCFPRRLPRNKVKDRRVDENKMAGNAEMGILTHQDKPLKQSNKNKTTSYPDMPLELSNEDKTTSHPGQIPRETRLKSVAEFAREFLASLYRLMTNPVYMLFLTSSVCYVFTYSGNTSFFSKYLERMFHLPVHIANYTTAGLVLCTSCFGTFMGGVLTRRLKMTAMSGLKFILLVTVVSFSSQILAFIFQCEQSTVYKWPGEENSCNSGCNCRDNSYFPICGGDGRTYYSPCHAGCLQAELGVYHNCSCVPGGGATVGTCYHGCWHLYGYLLVTGLRNLFMLLTVMPKLLVLMRCVPESDRSMALAVYPLLAAVFGWMLAPVLFGNVIDDACVIWDIKCLTRGRCLLYDNNHFGVTFNGYSALGLAGSLVFVVIAYLYARCTRCLDPVAQTQIVQERQENTPVVKNDSTVNI